MSRRPPCAGLWNTPMVHTDGRLTTCCLDEHMENVLGNLRDHSIGELWWGPTIHRWRVAQIEGRVEDSGPYCSRCNWRSAGSYPPDKVEEYLTTHGGGAALPSKPAPDGENE
jgi:radical SAM protein with 4Fe4S-binding SPASM domain